MKKTIRTAKEYDDVYFNQYVIRLCEYRMGVVQSTEKISDIERTLLAGQIEEVIIQAEKQLQLLVDFNEDVRPWEEPTPEVLEEIEYMRNETYDFENAEEMAYDGPSEEDFAPYPELKAYWDKILKQEEEMGCRHI